MSGLKTYKVPVFSVIIFFVVVNFSSFLFLEYLVGANNQLL